MNTTQRHINIIKETCHSLNDVRTFAQRVLWGYVGAEYKHGRQSDAYLYGPYSGYGEDEIGAVIVTETDNGITVRHYKKAPQKYIDRAKNATLWEMNYQYVQDRTIDEVMDSVNALFTFFGINPAVMSRQSISVFVEAHIRDYVDDLIPNHKYKTCTLVTEMCKRIASPFIEGIIIEDVKNAVRQNLISKGYDEEDADSQAQQIIEEHIDDVRRMMNINLSYLARPIMSKEQSYMEAIAKLVKQLTEAIESNQAA